MMYEVVVEVGSHGQAFEVVIEVDANDADDARYYAEEKVRDNIYIVAGEPKEKDEEDE
jgi:hypothetical protein